MRHVLETTKIFELYRRKSLSNKYISLYFFSDVEKGLLFILKNQIIPILKAIYDKIMPQVTMIPPKNFRYGAANITQLVRVLGCGSKSHRFESCYSPF